MRIGLILTVYIALAAMLLGVVLGIAAALGRLSRVPLLRTLSLAYITCLRGTPLIVQLTLVYYGVATLGWYSFPDWALFGLTLPGVTQAGILALGINKGAYVAEIVRSAIQSVDVGQWEAAQAIGMTRGQARWRVVLPQAARIATPALGNEFNAVLKDTSLLVVIGGAELFHAFQELNGALFLPFELYFAMSLYYLAMTAGWVAVQQRIERKLGRGFRPLATRAPRLGETLWRTS